MNAKTWTPHLRDRLSKTDPQTTVDDVDCNNPIYPPRRADAAMETNSIPSLIDFPTVGTLRERIPFCSVSTSLTFTHHLTT